MKGHTASIPSILSDLGNKHTISRIFLEPSLMITGSNPPPGDNITLGASNSQISIKAEIPNVESHLSRDNNVKKLKTGMMN